MSDRRNFIRQAGIFAGTLALSSYVSESMASSIKQFMEKAITGTAVGNAMDEDFWSWVKENYTSSGTLLNLNNGGVSPQPKVVQEAHERYLRMSNDGPSYYMWRILDSGREAMRLKLAELAGCDAEEIAVNRNTTEALNTVIFGMDLKAGDEVILSKEDYPNMINAWKQREKRDKIKLVWVDLDLPKDDNDTIYHKYTEKFTKQTKAVLVTHVNNWNGQILPVKRIARAAHEKGIEVIVDGAHSFAQLDFHIPDLECDYFGTSLHKWLCAPFGTGMLYIRREKIKNIWPLLGSEDTLVDNIRKFETIGTRSIPAEMAISTAIDFHKTIGIKRKEERLRYLKNYWVEKVSRIKGVQIHTPMDASMSCGLAAFSIDGMNPDELEQFMLHKYDVHTTPIRRENFNFVRVTPHVYTLPADLDRLISVVEKASESIESKKIEKDKKG